MISLTVLSHNGTPGDKRLTASFDELGGTIGRADTNQLVLPDPDRTISRVHARVVFRSGGYALMDVGSNAILINGEPVGSGRELPIKDGARVQIGGFVLGVKESDAAAGACKSVDDPFADLLGPGAAARSPSAHAAAGLIDPLAAFGMDKPSQPGVSPPAAYKPPPAPPAAGGIPEDWDPFAPDPVLQKPPMQDFAQSLGCNPAAANFGLDGGSGAPTPLVGGLPSSGANDSSLDALFGLKPGTGGGDPLANSLLDAPMSKPNMAANNDPLKSLRSAPVASAAAAKDNESAMHDPLVVPPAMDSRSTATQAPAPVVAAPTAGPVPIALAPSAPPAATPPPALFSWDSPETGGRTVIRPGVRAAPMPVNAVSANTPATPAMAAPVAPASLVSAAPSATFAPTQAPTLALNPALTAAAAPAAAQPSPAAATTTCNAHGPETAALLAAFREGIHLPNLPLEALTPSLMRLIGQLLHESARGTVDLLVARSSLKREMKAEATMISARENNPLKFSPSAEAALQHLLSPPIRGFMAPAPAMRDAFDDLRAHQYGFIAGMRAALQGVLESFSPAQLESRLTQRSGLMSFLPGSRKAAMWDVFVEQYGQISSDAEDDFHTVFGKAFLKAYEEHTAELRKGQA